MGCVQTKGKNCSVEAPVNKTLLISEQRRKVKGTVPVKRDDTSSESALSKDAMTYHSDVLAHSSTGKDFDAIHSNPVLIYPLPPTAAFPRPDAVSLPRNTSLVKSNEAKIPASTIESERKHLASVKEKEFLSTQTIPSDSYVIPASVHSSLSASTTFTFAPAQSFPAQSFQKLPVVSEELDGTTNNDSAYMKPMFGIPEAPEAAGLLENALHSVVDAGENLWNRAHATCNGSDSSFDEYRDASTSLRTKKFSRAGACC